MAAQPAGRTRDELGGDRDHAELPVPVLAVGRHDVDDVAAALERGQRLVVVAARQAGLGRRDVARRALDRHRHGIARHDAAEDRLLLEREVAVVEDRADTPRPEPIADRHPRRAGLPPG